jgi:natural product biosynthesis luciferase-like monooxygenase protein
VLGSDRNFLRTGDLGFVHRGNLYIAGRLKDTIIIRGLNYYPDDLETSVTMSHPAIGPGSTAAISIEDGNEERLIVLQEVARNASKLIRQAAASSIRAALIAEHNIAPAELILVRRGALPRTSSGKISRGACRSHYSSGLFSPLEYEEVSLSPPGGQPISTRRNVQQIGDGQQPVINFLVQEVGVELGRLDPMCALCSLGLDSLQFTHLKLLIEKVSGKTLPLAKLMNSTLGDLDTFLRNTKDVLVAPTKVQSSSDSRSGIFPLSEGQYGLWYDHQLDPNGSSRSVSRLLHLRGALDAELLVTAIDETVSKHVLLSCRIVEIEGTPFHEVLSNGRSFVEQFDVSNLNQAAVREFIDREHVSFIDLSEGPLLKLLLFHEGPESHYLLLCAHHLIVDLWSISLLASEITSAYRTALSSEQLPSGRPRSTYSDFVSQQRLLLEGHEGSRLKEFWKERLSAPLTELHLANRPQHSNQSGSGRLAIQINKELSHDLKMLSDSYSATLHTVILACVQIALVLHSGQNNFPIGLLTSGRDRAEWEEVVGYFINPVLIRVAVNLNDSFADILRNCRDELISAMENAAYPNRRIVADARKRSPPSALPRISVMCMLQPTTVPGLGKVATAGMGNDGEVLQCGEISVTALADQKIEDRFDLTIKSANVGDSIACTFDYQRGTFDDESIRKFAEMFRSLMKQVVSEPEVSLNNLLEVSSTINKLRSESAMESPDAVLGGQDTIHSLLEKQATENPTRIAVVDRCDSLSYLQLDQRANRLAHSLRSMDLGIEDKAAVYVDRSVNMVVAIAGVLKAGAAYVPIDSTCPPNRMRHILEESGALVVVTTRLLWADNQPVRGLQVVFIEDALSFSENTKRENHLSMAADNLAYVMYTSGSTGKPKGVMVTHGNVLNFFEGMDLSVGCGPSDALLSVTSIAFDISVLEMLWTLSRGCKVVIGDFRIGDRTSATSKSVASHPSLKFSLFYFASAGARKERDSYALLLEGAKRADELGFDAVWTPERHFDSFGGQYPNPALTSAALAFCTKRIHLRGGSVVLPINNPIRVAEQWAAVDSMSNGRTGIAFAPGWHVNDFVLAPENYVDRRKIMLDGVDLVRRLWRGEDAIVKNISGGWINVKTFPRPVQPELPIWLTSGGSVDTFTAAASIGANVLTHLLGQDLSKLAQLIKAHREKAAERSISPDPSTVTLMMHTYVDDSEKKVREKALGPFRQYLASSIDLIKKFIESERMDIDLHSMSEGEKADLLDFAAERYFATSGLLGTKASCLERLDHLASIGVNEVACLVDFGVDQTSVLESIDKLGSLQETLHRSALKGQSNRSSWPEIRNHSITLMQCTPSFFRMGDGDPELKKLLSGLDKLLLGGETVPPSIVADAREAGVNQVFNMYGPTETTIWSAAIEVDKHDASIIGGPIVNTKFYITDDTMNLILPPGEVGEIFIAGEGLARGYLDDPALTATRFIPDPFSDIPGRRMYRTGDRGRWLSAGRIEIVGRDDHQVKVRGNRVDLGEIETTLNRLPEISTSVVLQDVASEASYLIAFVIPRHPDVDFRSIRGRLTNELPSYMIPDRFEVIQEFPLTKNEKVDRKALLAPHLPRRDEPLLSKSESTRSSVDLEYAILSAWADVLGREDVPTDENFFDLGGHSLLMVQLHQKLKIALKTDFPLVSLVEHPTVSSFRDFMRGHVTPPKRTSERVEKQRRSLLNRVPRKNIDRTESRSDLQYD